METPLATLTTTDTAAVNNCKGLILVETHSGENEVASRVWIPFVKCAPPTIFEDNFQCLLIHQFIWFFTIKLALQSPWFPVYAIKVGNRIFELVLL